MRVGVIALTHNLILPEAFKRKKFSVKDFPDIRLEKNGDQINFIDSNLIYQLGNVQAEEIKKNPCFYTFADLNEKDLKVLENVYRNIVSNFITALWILKDNSVGSDLELYKIQNRESYFIRKVLFNSDSSSQYSDTSFKATEIDEAIKWFEILTLMDRAQVANEKKSYNYVQEEETVSNGIINIDKKFPHDDSNRLQRSLRFISVSRKQTVLHSKITYYISALESLLSTTEIELRMQVADRGARILGENYEDRVRIKNIISIAYSFRSKYIHGAGSSQKSMKKSLKFLGSVEELSKEMDEILRELIKLFLTDLNWTISLNEKEFADWTDELLYK